ncbi:tetratricopeptide repeat protein [Nostoc sp. DSM 114160]|jgi:tetratricopeptide (TPR) repeat protein
MPPEDSLLESKTRADQLFSEGTTSFHNKDYEAAISSYQEALTIFKKLELQRDIGLVLNAIGLSFYKLKLYSNAQKAFEDALIIFRSKETRDIDQEGRELNNLGINYDAIGNFAKAQENYKLALKIFEETKNKVEKARVINNHSYSRYLEEDYDSAYKMLPNAFDLFCKAKEIRGMEIASSNLINTVSRLANKKPERADGNHDTSPPPSNNY